MHLCNTNNHLKFTAMKTKILIITALVFAGILFTSCQKDNALLEDNATEQSFVVNNPGERDIEPETFLDFKLRLTNYPEPFYRCTTIEYELPYPANVKLEVCCQSDVSQYAANILVNEAQRQGIHRVEFNSCNLPVGEFIVYLTIDHRTISRTITKIDAIDTHSNPVLEQ